MNDLLQAAPRFLFFTGKGGVGKTSLSCATAVALADAGKRVLLISTDPASNLDEVLETPLSSRPTAVRNVAHLEALNIDPEAAAREYRERIVGPYRGVLPDAAVKSIEEQLSGACTVEIASFNEFTRLIADESAISGYDHVILDTAPTGHTLRLLSLPAAWNDFIADNKTGNSCLGPLAGLKEQRLSYEKTVTALQDKTRTLLVLVTRPEKSALKEAARASAELSSLGMNNQRLIVNGLFSAGEEKDELASAFADRCQSALRQMPDALRRLPLTSIPFRPAGFLGLASLRKVELPVFTAATATPAPLPDTLLSLDELVNDLSRSGKGVVMTMGKGGVGKTTIAAAIAVKLAEQGHHVLLSTTDPAAHIQDAVNGTLPNLRVSRIDPVAETKAHIERTMATTGAKLDAEGRALLEEELRSPCTEEIAVFTAFARTVAEGRNQFVVLDTAPTGHTLLLLDATESYHREVLRSTSDMPEAVRELLPRLRDPEFTRVLLVTLPEATPVHEAAQLQSDLQRAAIAPYAWVINQSFSRARTTHPTLLAKAANERRYVGEVVRELARRVVLVPWLAQEPSGLESLRELTAPPL
jgi:arsenite/tail-anchored protein-transporting ATPase